MIEQKRIQKGPNFPCLNLSVQNWNNPEDTYEVIWENDLVYTRNKNSVVGQEIIDSMGRTFTVIDVKYFSFVKKYLPFIAKGKMIFSTDCEERSVSEVKRFVLQKLDKLEKNELLVEWRNAIVKAKSISELYSKI